jgi:acetyl-CoA C-acetyltransferase
VFYQQVKQGPARQAMRKAGLPDSTGAVTINKFVVLV